MEFDPRKLQEMLAGAQKQAQELQQQMQSTEVEAASGGGSVTVRMTGQKRVVSVRIDPEVVKAGDVEMLQDLIVAAINEAGRKVEEVMQASVGGMLGGMGLKI